VTESAFGTGCGKFSAECNIDPENVMSGMMLAVNRTSLTPPLLVPVHTDCRPVYWVCFLIITASGTVSGREGCLSRDGPIFHWQDSRPTC